MRGWLWGAAIFRSAVFQAMMLGAAIGCTGQLDSISDSDDRSSDDLRAGDGSPRAVDAEPVDGFEGGSSVGGDDAGTPVDGDDASAIFDAGSGSDAGGELGDTGSGTVEWEHFHVEGRAILDPTGSPVVLRGVNKMNIYTDREGESFPEIAESGANTVRIVWRRSDDDFVPTAGDLDAILARAVENDLVPMIELHDATGDLGALPDLVAYWTRPDIADAVQAHERYVLVNIGNEVGDDTVTLPQFVSAYTTAVLAMRAAGYDMPLVIDAPDWGKNLTLLTAAAPMLLAADPDHNLIFSVHIYWPEHRGADAMFIRESLEDAVGAGYALVIGEFSHFGAYSGEHVSACSMAGEIDYETILEVAHEYSIGWYAWEWGPGNTGGGDLACIVMDMTVDSTFETLKSGWATDVVIDSPYGIMETSVIAPVFFE